MNSSAVFNASEISANLISTPTICLGNVTFNATLLNTTTDCIGKDNDRKAPPPDGSSPLFILEICFTCFDVISLLSSVVLMVLIYKATKLKDMPARLLLNMAVADTAEALFWLLLYGCMYTVPDVGLIQKLIFVQRIAFNILSSESFYSLAAVLFILHLAICDPIHYKLYSKVRHGIIILATSWTINIASTLMIFLTDNLYLFERDSILPVSKLDRHNAWYAGLTIVVGYIVPLTIIIVSYIRLWKHRRDAHNSEVESQSTTRNTVRHAQGILLYSLCAMITYGPLHIFEYLASSPFLTSAMNEDTLFILGTLLASIGYAPMVLKIPLFLYGFRSYRRVFLNMWCFRCISQIRRPAQRNTPNEGGSGTAKKHISRVLDPCACGTTDRYASILKPEDDTDPTRATVHVCTNDVFVWSSSESMASARDCSPPEVTPEDLN